MCRFQYAKMYLFLYSSSFLVDTTRSQTQQSECQDNFDSKAEIIGDRWISVSEEAMNASRNGIFCTLRERSVINYHISKSQEYNYNEKIDWKKAHCFSTHILMFDGGRPDKQKLGDPWTEEQYFVSILCVSPLPIKFKFIGLQPLTHVDTLEDYDMAMARFRLTVTIPYFGEKTGNYTFSSGRGIDLATPDDWFYIYFKRISPPYIIGQLNKDSQRKMHWQQHPYIEKPHMLIPCRITNPEYANHMLLSRLLKKGNHNTMEDVSGPGVEYSSLEGFTVDTKVLGESYRNTSFICRRDMDIIDLAIFEPPLEKHNFITKNKRIEKLFTLGCSRLGNGTWDYISNIYASTPMESDMLRNCLFKDAMCDWSSNWDTTGERVLEGSRKNRRVVHCESDPEGYPCALVDVFPSGMVACFKNKDIVLEEKYFTGMDKKIYFLSELKTFKMLKDVVATLNSPHDEEPNWYSDMTYTMTCSAIPYLFIPGYTWSIRLRNGTTVENLGPNFPIREWAGADKAKGIRSETVHLKFSSDTVSLSCNFYAWDSNKKFNVKMDLVVKDKSVPKFIPTETNVTFARFKKKSLVRCSVYGVPLPSVSWFKNNELVTDSSFRVVDGDVVHLDLHFSNNDESSLGTNLTFAGEYICTANNSEGSVSQTYHVNLDDLPKNTSYNIYWIITVSVLGLLIAIIITVSYKFYKGKYIILTNEDLEKFKNGKGKANYKEERNSIDSNVSSKCPDNFKMIAYDIDYEVSSNDYQIDFNKILGSGQFGIVLRGKLRGKDVAIKTVHHDSVDRETLLSFMDEIKVMMYLGSHPNLVKLLGSDTKRLEKGRVYLFLEFCPMGSVLNFLRDKTQKFHATPPPTKRKVLGYENVDELGEKRLLMWCCQITHGMSFLARRNVIHGDLAARNVLLQDLNTVKITDFGLSRQLHNYAIYKKTKNQPLPWRWLSPEALTDMEFSTKSDVWALGVTMWEIFSLGAVPYSGLGWTADFTDRLLEGLRLHRPALASMEMYGVMKKCWMEVVEDRPDLSFVEDKTRALLQENENELNIYTTVLPLVEGLVEGTANF